MRAIRLAFVAALLAAFALPSASWAVAGKIVIRNLDSAGEGFNLGTAAAPVGGNPGTTVGQQRLNLFQHAADIWGAILQNIDTIYVNSNFDSLTCGPTSAVLGSAGPKTLYRDFTGATFAGTWYHAALANNLHGTLINSRASVAIGEITARFNSELDGDPGCLGGKTWYYGYDGNEGSLIELLPVVLHELGHGLGFSTPTDGQTGNFASGFTSAFDHFLYDSTTHRTWSNAAETSAQRAASALSVTGLVWNGPAVTYGINNLAYSAGFDPVKRALMYAPASYQAGSSVSHFDVTFTPNVLMEPALNANLSSSVDLTKHAFVDLGWLPMSTAAVLARFSAEDYESGVLVQWQFADPAEVVSQTVERAPSDAGPWTAVTGEVFTRDGQMATLDRDVTPGQTWFYRLRATDTQLRETVYAQTSVRHTGIPGGPAALFAPSPNPTASGTTFAFRLPRPEFVHLDIVDASGRRVRTLQDGLLAPGDYQRWWDGASDGRAVAPGLYFARLRTSQGVSAQRVAVIH